MPSLACSQTPHHSFIKRLAQWAGFKRKSMRAKRVTWGRRRSSTALVRAGRLQRGGPQGEQPAIVDRALFDAVQAKLNDQATNHKTIRMQSEALLAGRIFDDRGNRMGIVTLMNDRRDKSCIQSRSCRGGDLAPCLHGRGSERPVRLC